MKLHWVHFLIFSLTIFSSCYRPASRQAFEDVKVIEGKWASTEGTQFNEYWTIINDSLLQGLGFSLNNGDTAFVERLKIFREKDQVFYAAKVNENADFVLFRLKEAGRNTWTFVNPDHDYPNIIEYKLKSENTLVAKTANIRGNKEVVFKMKRIVE